MSKQNSVAPAFAESTQGIDDVLRPPFRGRLPIAGWGVLKGQDHLRRHGKLARRPPLGLQGLLQSGAQLGHPLGCHLEWVPRVAVAGGAPDRRGCVASDVDGWVRLLDPFGPHLRVSEPIGGSVDARARLGPERLDDGQALIRSGPAIREGIAEGLEFFAEPSHPDPEVDPAVAELVELRDLGRHLDGIPHGENQHALVPSRTRRVRAAR